MIKSDFRVDPGIIFVGTLPLVRDLSDRQPLIVLVQTFVELSAEELDAHDGEDEPEHQADQQHVEDGGNGVHQSIHHNLKIEMIKWESESKNCQKVTILFLCEY